HDFKRPSLDLTKSASDDAVLGREHYDYPGRYVDPEEGARRAQLRLDAMSSASSYASGTGTAFSMSAGHTFTLSAAPDPAHDREWVVAGLEQEWINSAERGTSFTIRFRLLPKDAKFRPEVRTPRAVVPGPQLALVTGPSGEEIHCDEHGRIKVHFPW